MLRSTLFLSLLLSGAALPAGLPAQQSPTDPRVPAASQAPTQPPQVVTPPQPATPPQADAQSYTLTTTTREVDLDVVVTDAKGEPVSGLTKEDLQILEDHKPQRALSFESHAPGTAATAIPLKLPPNTFTNYVPGSTGHSQVVLLLDSLDTPLRYQPYGYQQAIEFIKHLPPGVDLAIFTLNARMELLQGFTSDAKLLLQAMQSKRAQPRPSYLIDSAPGTAILQQGNNDVYRRQLILEGMSTLARYLAGFPGHKSLIWLTADIPGYRSLNVASPSGGGLAGADAAGASSVTIPSFGDTASTNATPIPSPGGSSAPAPAPPGQLVSGAPPGGTVPGANARRSEEELELTTFNDPFNTAGGGFTVGRVATYIVDQRGLMSPGEVAANPDFAFQFEQMDHAAEITGGHAFHGTNRLDLVMQQIAVEGANYYRLTYSPTNRDWDGSFRHLQVKLDASARNPLLSSVTGKPAVGPLHLAYRAGYYASGGNPAVAARTSAADNGPASFTLASENAPNVASGIPRILPKPESLQASMTMGELPPTEVAFLANVKPAPDILQLGKNSALPPGDFMRPKFKKLPYRQLNILFATNIRTLDIPVASDRLHHGKVEFVSVIYNDKGDVVNSLITSMALDLREPTYRKLLQAGIAAHQTIAVPVKGEYVLRLGVHDSTSDRTGALEVPLRQIQLGDAAPVASTVKP